MNQNLIAAEVDAVMPAVIATGLLVSVFTALQPSTVLGATGAPNGTYTAVTGLTGIACTSPPESIANIKAMESKAIEEVAATEFHHVLLDAYYPTLCAGWRAGWRCTIDGTTFDITGVEHDSQFQMSRVCVRKVST